MQVPSPAGRRGSQSSPLSHLWERVRVRVYPIQSPLPLAGEGQGEGEGSQPTSARILPHHESPAPLQHAQPLRERVPHARPHRLVRGLPAHHRRDRDVVADVRPRKARCLEAVATAALESPASRRLSGSTLLRVGLRAPGFPEHFTSRNQKTGFLPGLSGSIQRHVSLDSAPVLNILSKRCQVVVLQFNRRQTSWQRQHRRETPKGRLTRHR